MARRYPVELLSEIKARIDLAALVGEHVRLTRRGASFVGLCPFHAERTPSFYVHPGKGFFYCFGCGASGDAIGFLIRAEGRSFPEAVVEAGRRAGVPVPELDESSPEEETARRREADRREWLLKANEMACRFFEEQLASPGGQAARRYLRERGIGDATASTHRLGFAPPLSGALVEHLRQQGVPPEIVEAAGLARPRRDGSGHGDLFRNRLMVPVTDPFRRVVGFSGRALGEGNGEGEGPKYLNSPETAVFRKGAILLGLALARDEVRRGKVAVLVEGNFDILALWEHGFRNAVAPMGTALTPAQAALLARNAEEVVVAYDGDRAGREAADRVVKVLLEAGLRVKVASLPDGEDPASLVLRPGGPATMADRIRTAPWALEYLLARHGPGADAAVEERMAALRALRPIVAAVQDPVEQDLYRRKVADALGLHPRHVLGDEAASLAGKARRASPLPVSFRKGTGQVGGAAQRVRPSRWTHGGSGRREGTDAPPDLVEGTLLRLLLDHPGFIPEVEQAGAVAAFGDGARAEILRCLFRLHGGGGPRAVDAAALLHALPDPAIRATAARLLGDERGSAVPPDLARQVLSDTLDTLRRRSLQPDPLLDAAQREALLRGDEESALRLAQTRAALARQRVATWRRPGVDAHDTRSRE